MSHGGAAKWRNSLRAGETASGGTETKSPEKQSKLNSQYEQIFLYESIKAIPSWHISELWEQLELDSLKDKERFILAPQGWPGIFFFLEIQDIHSFVGEKSRRGDSLYMCNIYLG